MKLKTPSPEWVDKAKLLSRDEAERILARMRKKLTHKLEDDEIAPLEAVALQLQLEDEQLNEWRAKIAELRKHHAAKHGQ